MKSNYGNPKSRRPGRPMARRRTKPKDAPGGLASFWKSVSYRFKREPKIILDQATPRQSLWRRPAWLEKILVSLGRLELPWKKKIAKSEAAAVEAEAAFDVGLEDAEDGGEAASETAAKDAAEISEAPGDAEKILGEEVLEPLDQDGRENADESRYASGREARRARKAGQARRGGRRLLAVLGGLAVAAVLAAFILAYQKSETVSTSEPAIKYEYEEAATETERGGLAKNIVPGSYESARLEALRHPVSELTVKNGDTLSSVLEELGLPAKGEGGAIVNFLKDGEILSVLRPGARLVAYWNDHDKTEFEQLEYYPENGGPPVMLRPDGAGGYWGFSLGAPGVTVQSAAEGVMESSLWEAAEKNGLPVKLITDIAEIMASDIDFVTDIQKGDSFQLLYQCEYQDGRPRGVPVIDMIRVVSRGDNHEYYRYVDSDGNAGYYNPNGISNKKSFLMSPLKFANISSEYSKARMHPIFKVVRPHEGVDYAAPAGTPVVSVADGTVAAMGWAGGYGNRVIVRHDERRSTMYAHLSRFPKGLKKGAPVKQGDLVGYVGATGTATGPHLDFRLEYNGAFVDPLPELAKQEGRPIEPFEQQPFTQAVTRARTKISALLGRPAH